MSGRPNRFRKSGDLQTLRCGSGEPHERVISYQVKRKVKVGFRPSHTSETLMAFTLCWALGFHYCQFVCFHCD